ncbi:hypothetical protein [Chryseosolibacter indicus]|uniref:Lipocalin-like domain-containing protein n=1 Tax=Chryseosolibacter indicus TaxID=2782351 RepID=A0ABS5VN82_9BACT|nr:hypothetical protein [Chryseosolibacter indicus]MBT1702214.1 hypothetical protein [Chryseosolibacter indicus]
MRKIPSIIAVVLSIISLASTCDDNESHVSQVEPKNVAGRWVLYERGYSPGSGYITEQIPANPAQEITLEQTKRFTSNIQGLSDYKFYEILDDTNLQVKVLALFKAKPEGFVEINNLEHSYNLEVKDGNLRLAYRFCIEGCHMAFKPAKSTN